MSWFDGFSFAPLNCRIRAKEEFVLPGYKGGTLRGSFGYAFKKAVCVTRSKECAECLLQDSCVYAYIFETPRPKNTSVMRKYEHIPHPFVFLPPLNRNRLIRPGDVLEFRMVLMGRAIEYLSYFVFVLQAMCEQGLGQDRGQCELEQVSSGEIQVYTSGSNKVYSPRMITARDLLDKHSANSRKMSLQLNTPLKLIRNGRILQNELHFQDIFRSLLRRVALLGQFHCSLTPDCDFRDLIDQAGEVSTRELDLSWMNWSRYSTRQQKSMPGSGFVGQISFEGDLDVFRPYLSLGEYVHVGKNTSFGLGNYKIIQE